MLCECGCGTPVRPGAKRLRGHRDRDVGPCWLEQDCGYDTPCWVWQRGLSAGYATSARRDGRTGLVHRRMYEDAHGIRLGRWLVLDHLCNNPRCVNPEHLEPVTQAENVRRGYASQRAQWAETLSLLYEACERLEAAQIEASDIRRRIEGLERLQALNPRWVQMQAKAKAA